MNLNGDILEGIFWILTAIVLSMLFLLRPFENSNAKGNGKKNFLKMNCL